MNFKFSRNKYHKEDSFDSDMMFGQLNCNWDNHAGNDRSFPNHNHNHLANSFASITQNNHSNHHTFTHNNNNNNLNHHHHHHRDPIGRQNRMPNGQLAESLLNHNSTFRLIEAAKGSILANGRQNACNEQDDSLNGRIQFSMSEVLSDIRDIMEALYESKTQEQQDASVAEEWRIVARVLDRILGLCYCATFFSVFAFLDYDMFT
ncbi:uncharacterized protein LOC142351145 [Convolutriloba macropyga]|uniref:uncharacterized protein LOC142351145 n=1 Tax=Convolutriloba macropyga TaxID=536237 RepID=UPI003F525345